MIRSLERMRTRDPILLRHANDRGRARRYGGEPMNIPPCSSPESL